jgi:hypothetical protein
MVQKHVAFAPGNKWGQGINGARPHFVKKRIFSYRKWGLAPFIPKASLSSPSERNHARLAFLTVFLPYSLHRASAETNNGNSNRKWGLSPFFNDFAFYLGKRNACHKQGRS